MNIIEFFNYIFSVLTGFSVPNIDEVTRYFTGISHFCQIFNPPYFLSALVYIFVGWFIIQFTMILPYRVAKILVKFPSRKRCER